MFKLYFLTSSRTKLAHARHLAKHLNLDIERQWYYGVAYSEPRVNDRSQLLEASFANALDRWNKDRGAEGWFFIEDTSVIIDALSVAGQEVPGVDVKYWMETVSFAQLNEQLLKHGDNRRATVRSDVYLYVPPAFRRLDISRNYVSFTGYTAGSIIKAEMPITTDIVYPWLDSKSFNKWFVPDGELLPLSALPIQDADNHDIRSGSVGAMLAFLVAMHVVNLRNNEHTVATSYLPFPWPPLLIVCGLPCAGKTTLGGFLSAHCGYHHIEASDFMRLAFLERNGPGSSNNLDEFASRVLIEEPSIVVDQVLKEIALEKNAPIVITGFRANAEVESFLRKYNGSLQIVSIFLEANAEMRFKRSQLRDREDALKTFQDFIERDRLQEDMGLALIRDRSGQTEIRNEGSIPDLYSTLRSRWELENIQMDFDSLPAVAAKITRLEERVLVTLAKRSQFTEGATTTQLAHNIAEVFAGSEILTNKNNISRYFNSSLRAYYRVRISEGKTLYSISATGHSKALMVLRKILEVGTQT